MKVMAIQWRASWESTTVDIDKLENIIEQFISDNGNLLEDQCDLLVLPETFNSGFSMRPETYAESVDGEISQLLSGLAKRYQMNIVAGVAQKQVRRNCDGQALKFYNRALAFNRQGEQIGSYTKQKLFSFANEHDAFQAGHKSEVIEIDGEPFALMICYDLRFPELFREIADQVKGVIVIANWPDSRQLHWETLLQARAIENQCFVIGVNRIGKDENSLNYIGGSAVFSPLGEKLAYGEADQQAIVAGLDLQQVEKVRAQFPFLKDMKL